MKTIECIDVIVKRLIEKADRLTAEDIRGDKANQVTVLANASLALLDVKARINETTPGQSAKPPTIEELTANPHPGGKNKGKNRR